MCMQHAAPTCMRTRDGLGAAARVGSAAVGAGNGDGNGPEVLAERGATAIPSSACPVAKYCAPTKDFCAAGGARPRDGPEAQARTGAAANPVRACPSAV